MITARKEQLGKLAFATASAVSVISVLSIFAFLFARGLPAISHIGWKEFLLGRVWSPDREDTYTSAVLGSYGILPMIAGTGAVTLGALLFGGVAGVFTSVFLVYFCPARHRKRFSAVIHLLAGIPSVVYGFFGIVFLLPMLSRVAPNNGSGLLAASLILGLMILPTVVSLSSTALLAVPESYRHASIALGATRTETIFRVAFPAARSGITTSLILGIGRALGETMAVVMVAGNAPIFPSGLFRSFRVMTANIVMEMGYAGDLQEGTLVATGVVLFVFVLIVNLLFHRFSHRAVQQISRTTKQKRRRLIPSSLAYFKSVPLIGRILAYAFGLSTLLSLILILGFLCIKGLPPLLTNSNLIFGRFEFGSHQITLLPAIVTTLMVLLLSISLAIPIGVMSAIFLHEYAKPKHPAVRILRLSIDILSGVPSIVYGLFGMIAFLPIFGGTSSILAGSLTISMMLLPTAVRATEESLSAVDNSLRAGSLALGAGKLRTVIRIVIPAAAPGILSAVILSMGRVISESAPFLYTTGSVISAIPRSYLDSGATLAVSLYQLSGEGWYQSEAYAAAVILILVIFCFNALAEHLSEHLLRRTQQ